MSQEIAVAILIVMVIILGILYRKKSVKNQKLADENIRLQTELNISKGLADGTKEKYDDMAASVFREQTESFKTEATAPVINTVNTLRENIDQLMRKNEAQSATFTANMENMAKANNEMMKNTSIISDVLKNSQKHGRHAEIGIERIFEMSNLIKGIHYNTQQVTDSGQRIDFVVKLSEDRIIIIDSKAPLSALLESFDADDEATKTNALDRHVAAVKKHITDLSKQEYPEQAGSTLEYVIMVVPEYALLPALERESEIVVFALKHNVILATHSTLMVLLRTVELMWKQSEMTDRIKNIGVLSTDVYERLCKFTTHYANTGKGLEDAIKKYNEGVGSWTSRVIPKAKELSTIGSTTKKLTDVKPVDRALRPLPEEIDSDSKE